MVARAVEAALLLLLLLLLLLGRLLRLRQRLLWLQVAAVEAAEPSTGERPVNAVRVAQLFRDLDHSFVTY